jgi:hypothetical protein
MFVNIHAIQSYTWFMKQHLKKKKKCWMVVFTYESKLQFKESNKLKKKKKKKKKKKEKKRLD